MKLKNMKRGVSDLCLPFPHGRYHGLYIEMKYGKNRLTEDQSQFLCDMCDARHCVAVCHDAQSAIRLIEEYLNLPRDGGIDPDLIDGTDYHFDENGICHIKLTDPFA